MKTAQRKVRLGLRFRLFTLVLVGFSGLIALTVWQIGVEADKVANASIKRSLEQSEIILDENIQSRFLSIKDTVDSLAKDGRILPLVFDGDSITLQDLSYEFQEILSYDVSFFLDGNGVLLARSDRPELIGRSLAGRSQLFDSALSGESAQGIISIKNRLLQIVALPIFDNVATDVVRGAVALAYDVSAQMAEKINKLTESDVAFFIIERKRADVLGVSILHNTRADLSPALNDYFAANPKLWQSIATGDFNNKNLQVSLNDEIFHIGIHGLANNQGTNLGFVMTMRSRTELLAPFVHIQQQVAIIGFLCLLLACLLAWLIAFRISKPITELVSVARNIRNGHYPGSSPYQKRSDEVGVLYDAVIDMGTSIKEKNELEGYLANLSDGIPIGEDDHLLNDLQNTSMLMTGVSEDIDNTGQDFDATANATLDGVAEEGDATTVDGNRTVQHDSGAGSEMPQVGMCVGERYQVIRLLGVGAMGYVYLVKDKELDELVALKVLKSGSQTHQDQAMLKEEIRLARKITHRNILRTFDFGNWNAFTFITMEFVHGYDLTALVKHKGKLNSYIGVVMAKQICSAVEAAHEEGIIHRDLKPSNIMINRHGVLKIMDFGLAMTVDESMKGSGQVAGTPNYMAPEQFLGKALDARTDIYAVGVILYFMFAGRLPFSGKTFDELGHSHMHDVPQPVSEFVDEFPKALDDIINKAMAKSKEDRFQNVKELIDALQAC